MSHPEEGYKERQRLRDLHLGPSCTIVSSRWRVDNAFKDMNEEPPHLQQIILLASRHFSISSSSVVLIIMKGWMSESSLQIQECFCCISQFCGCRGYMNDA